MSDLNNIYEVQKAQLYKYLNMYGEKLVLKKIRYTVDLIFAVKGPSVCLRTMWVLDKNFNFPLYSVFETSVMS